MKSKHQKLLSWRKAKGCTLNAKINLDRLFETARERERFDAKWKDFIASDSDNKKVYKKNGNILSYKSEQLIPTKTDKRPPLLLVLGNPATHCVAAGMFFSFEGHKKEHRFWSRILKPAGVLDLPFNPGLSIEKLNKQRRGALFNLDYESVETCGVRDVHKKYNFLNRKSNMAWKNIGVSPNAKMACANLAPRRNGEF